MATKDSFISRFVRYIRTILYFRRITGWTRFFRNLKTTYLESVWVRISGSCLSFKNVRIQLFWMSGSYFSECPAPYILFRTSGSYFSECPDPTFQNVQLPTFQNVRILLFRMSGSQFSERPDPTILWKSASQFLSSVLLASIHNYCT